MVVKLSGYKQTGVYFIKTLQLLKGKLNKTDFGNLKDIAKYEGLAWRQRSWL